MNDREVLEALYATVENRRDNPKEGSYTCYLLDKGIDKILKKAVSYTHLTLPTNSRV